MCALHPTLRERWLQSRINNQRNAAAYIAPAAQSRVLRRPYAPLYNSKRVYIYVHFRDHYRRPLCRASLATTTGAIRLSHSVFPIVVVRGYIGRRLWVARRVMLREFFENLSRLYDCIIVCINVRIIYIYTYNTLIYIFLKKIEMSYYWLSSDSHLIKYSEHNHPVCVIEKPNKLYIRLNYKTQI